MDFEKLLAENEWAEIIERVKKFDPFEIIRFDKQSKIELRIGLRFCDNGIWQDDCMCYIDGSKKCGDYHGFGSPFQRNEFLKLTYNDIAKYFAVYGFVVTKVKQLSMFAFV